MFVTGENIQIHGGVGLHVGLRRAPATTSGRSRTTRCSATRAGSAAASPTSCSTPRVTQTGSRRSSPRCTTPSPSTSAPATRSTSSSGTPAGRAAAREVVRQWWGRDPGFTLVMLSLSSLGALFFRGGLVAQGRHRLLGRHVPELHAEPDLRPGVPSGARSRSSTGRSSRSRSGSRPRPAACPRSSPARSPARRWRRTTRYAAVDTPFGEVGLLAPLAPDVALLHAPVADRQGNVAVHPPLLEGRVGRAGRPPGRDRHGRAGRRRPPAVVAPRAHPRAPGARGLRGADGRAPRRPVHGRPARRRVRRGLRVLGRGPRREPRATTTTTGSATGCSTSTTQDEYLAPSRRRPGRGAARQGRARLVAHRRGRVPPRPRRAPEPVGAGGRRWGARHLAERVLALDAHAVLAGAGVANLAAWLGVAQARAAGERRAAHRRDRTVGLRARRRPTRSCSTTATSRVRRCSATPALVLGTLVGGPGTTHDRVPRRRAGRPLRQRQLDARSPTARSSSARAAATTSPASPPRRSWSRRSRPAHAARACGYVTSPGRAVRALVTDLGTLEKLDGDELVLTAVPGRGRTRSPTGSPRRAPPAAGTSQVAPTTCGSCAGRRADEVAALRALGPPRLVPPRPVSEPLPLSGARSRRAGPSGPGRGPGAGA